MVSSNKRLQTAARPLPVALLSLLLAVLLLGRSAAVGEGVRRGLVLCANVVIPSLFPFMVLAGFLALSPACRLLALPLRPLSARLLKLPEEMGAVVLMSFIGGYPVGARLVSDMLRQGRIDRSTAQRMLCFCVNPGPSFLISGVGVALYGSAKVGLLLLAAQVVSSLLVGMFLSLKTPVPKTGPAADYPPLSAALVQAVTGAAAGMLNICAFVVVFSAVGGLLESTGSMAFISRALSDALPFVRLDERFYTALFTGLLEVTGGTVAAAKLPLAVAFPLTAFLISFGGLSILCQAAAFFPKREVSLMPMVLARVAGGALTLLLALPLYRAFAAELPVYGVLYPPVTVADPRSAVLAVALIGMCSILLLTLSVKLMEWGEAWRERREAQLSSRRSRANAGTSPKNLIK